MASKLLFLPLIVLSLFGNSILADDAVQTAIEQLRRKRGEAIAKENEVTIRSLQSILNQRKSERNSAEVERLELFIGQLKDESEHLKAKGDRKALLPSNPKQLRAFLIGTAWSFDGTSKSALEFQADGTFKGTNEAFQYTVIGSKKLTIIWSPSSRIDCELNEDGNVLTELAGAHGVLKRVR